MTIRQSARLDTMHQDIRLCGWTRASPAEVVEAKYPPLVSIDMSKGSDQTVVYAYGSGVVWKSLVVDLSGFFAQAKRDQRP